MKYITINPISEKVRAYDTLEDATKESIALNQSDSDHPAFRLHAITDNNKVVYRGRLTRKFGSNRMYWNTDAVQP